MKWRFFTNNTLGDQAGAVVFEPAAEWYDLSMWGWGRKRANTEGFPGFPQGFKVQRIGIAAAKAISELPAGEIAKYLRQHPEIARALLGESYDKRFSPSSFIVETGGGFAVGWFSKKDSYQCVQEFSDLADAATDYLLFSLGKGRWTQGSDAIQKQ